jgi:selenocysteine-specific elongation factor
LEVPKFPEVLTEVVAGSSFSVQDARKFFQMFLDAGEIVKISEEFYFYKPVIEQLIGQLKAFAAATPDQTIDMAKFKDLAGVSRKYAVPLLEYFDRERITVRRGDQRFII